VPRRLAFFLSLLLPAALGCSGSQTVTAPPAPGGLITGAGGGLASATSAGAGGASTIPTAGTGGSGGSSRGSGAAAGSGGAGGSFPLGAPIDAPNDQWTWVPFPDAVCANGTSTGLGIYPSSTSNRLLFFLMGGGACWDQANCADVPTSLYLTGYDATSFATDPQRALSVLDRSDPDNPFADYSVVYIPYCTGDVFSGSNVVTWSGQTFNFVGSLNIIAYLERVVPTFAGVERVVLAGDSAGGFGAGINWWRVQEAFGSTRVDMVDDSGPPLPAPYLSTALAQQFRDTWNMNAALPPGCTACPTHFEALFDYYGATMTGHRGALLSYEDDSIISTFFSTTEFTQGLDALAVGDIDPTQNLHYFFIPGALHVVETSMINATSSGVTLGAWLGKMESDDPTWTSAGP
jgi:Pectinacetylesterase